jgi:hypothetical protein
LFERLKDPRIYDVIEGNEVEVNVYKINANRIADPKTEKKRHARRRGLMYRLLIC